MFDWSQVEKYNVPFHGNINQQAYQAHGQGMEPAQAVSEYLKYLEREWADNEAYSLSTGNDPYGWQGTWLGETFSDWLKVESRGGIHKQAWR